MSRQENKFKIYERGKKDFLNEIIMEVSTSLMYCFQQRKNIYIKDCKTFSQDYLIPAFLNGLLFTSQIENCLLITLESQAAKWQKLIQVYNRLPEIIRVDRKSKKLYIFDEKTHTKDGPKILIPYLNS